MTDNFYKGICPPKSGPGFRELSNYTNNLNMNLNISNKNSIKRDDEYRLFLQKNGMKIIENEWNKLRNNNSCAPNNCIFKNPKTLVHPYTFNEEMERNNNTLTQKYECKQYDDYRLFKK